jgi:hypothetical protein
LPAHTFVGKWTDRNLSRSDSLLMIAELSDTESDLIGMMAVARSIYGHLPKGGAHFWQGRKHVVTSDPRLSLEAITSGS